MASKAKHIYLISGLGADEKVFDYLDCLKKEDIVPHYISWLEPDEGETIEHYASRMAAGIIQEDALLIGLSFGGIISIEIAKQIPIKKCILISSCKTSKEIPVHFKLIGGLGLNKIAPIHFLKKQEALIQNFLGANSVVEKDMVNRFIAGVSDNYLTWSIHTIFNWKNKTIPPNVYHIHGTADMVLPYQFVHADYNIQNGNHFMLINKAKEVNDILEKLIEEG